MSHASTWAIVPVKALGDAKQRLAPVLPLEARRKLMLVMLEDVLATLRQAEGLGPILVVTPDAAAAEIAETAGALILREARGTGHSAAVVAGFAHARAHGATHALTLPADVPLATPHELYSLLDTCGSNAGRSAGLPSPLRGGVGGGGQSPSPRASPTSPRTPSARGEGRGEGRQHAPPFPLVTLVPSRDGDGTNAMLVSPPDAFTPSFGPGSFARHLADAAKQGLACRTLGLPGLGLDIDEPADLDDLMRRTRTDPRYAFLAHHALLSAGAAEP